MPEYIDITKLKNQISDLKRAVHCRNSDYLNGYISALSATEVMIAETPTADVAEVKHGKWIKHKPDPVLMDRFHEMGFGRAMSTCKDCLHVEVCELCYNSTDEEYVDVADKCKHFKDKSKSVDLPVKVGGTVYHLLRTGAIAKRKVKKYILTSSDGLCYVFDSNEIYLCTWKSVFPTKEEAEQALVERSKNDG